MNVTVCQLRSEPTGLKQDWNELVSHVKNKKSDLIVLPEMPFFSWMAWTDHFDSRIWKQAVDSHNQWMFRLNELAPEIILGTRPIIRNGRNFNEGFIWRKKTGYQGLHVKYYLPNEQGFWEATWYERGEKSFTTIVLNDACFGFLICTELWFTEHARAYAKQGIQLLLCPRATFFSTVEKWILAGRVAAIMSGAYCLSSNRRGYSKHGVNFGGKGWIIEPENGTILGTTSPEMPFCSLEIDLNKADDAKKTYPRDVLE